MKKKIYIFIFILFLCCCFFFRDKKEDREIRGSYLEESGMLFFFSNEDSYWYKDYNDLEYNYYKGKVKIKSLCSYHYKKKEIKKKYGKISCKDYYEVYFYPEYLVKNKEKIAYQEEEPLKFALYFYKKDKTYLYDFSKKVFYEVAKFDNF